MIVPANNPEQYSVTAASYQGLAVFTAEVESFNNRLLVGGVDNG